jgi:NAD(P)-dependent dehydrogenase (short-subunit alcohol dehydrogenase family)
VSGWRGVPHFGIRYTSLTLLTHSASWFPVGIGASIALALAQAGAHVILVHRSPQTPTTTLQQIHSQGHSASVVYADLALKEQVNALIPTALDVLKKETHGQNSRIDILVHAAGIQRRAPAAEFKDEEWEEVSSQARSLRIHYVLTSMVT